MLEQNAEENVTWLSAFVSDQKRRTVCVDDVPTWEAVHRTVARNELPVDDITQVRVLDPYFYR